MKGRRFQRRVITAHYTLPISVALAVALWMLAGWISPYDDGVAGQVMPWEWPSGLLMPWVSRISGLSVHLLTGLLLIALNNMFGLIRLRASIQTTIYFLLIAACPLLHGLQEGQAAAIAIVASLFPLLASYHDEKAARHVFLAFALLGLGSLVVPQLTLLVPVYWIGAYYLRALSAKSFAGSLLGWFMPYWFLFCYAVYTDRIDDFVAPFEHLATILSGPFSWRITELTVAMLYLFFVFLSGSIQSMSVDSGDNTRTRSHLRFIILLGASLMLMGVVLPGCIAVVYPAAAACASILAGHMFAQTDSRASNRLFIFMLMAWAALCIFNLLWTT